MDTLRATKKAGAEDHVGAAIEKRFEELAVVAWIVFEVGVLNEDNVAGNLSESATKSGTLALIAILEKDAQIAESDGVGAVLSGSRGFARALKLDKLFEDLASTVGGAIIDDHDFLAKLGFDDAAEDFIESGFFVIHGNDDGKFGINQRKWVVTWMGHK